MTWAFYHFSSDLFKQNILINDENCLYQISNFKFATQHNRRIAARHKKKLLSVEILSRGWETFYFSFFLSTFCNFLLLLNTMSRTLFFFQFLLFFALETKQEYKDSQEKPVHGKSVKVCLRGLKFQNSDSLKFKFRWKTLQD